VELDPEDRAELVAREQAWAHEIQTSKHGEGSADAGGSKCVLAESADSGWFDVESVA
jgi:hypothetical protein